MTGLPYYLLGRVPCRSVSLVAIVVEATAYENRLLYTRKPYCLCRTTSKIYLQWTMALGPSNVRFASTRMLKGIKPTKNDVLPVQLKSQQRRDLPLSPLAQWSKSKAEFVRSDPQGRFTANQLVRHYPNSFLRGHSDKIHRTMPWPWGRT